MKILPTLIATVLINMIALVPTKAQVVCDSVFTKEYISTGNIEPFTTKYLSTGEILIAGRGSDAGTGKYHAMAVKLSSSGTVIWSVLIGGNLDERFTGITELNDGTYLLYGIAESFGYSNGKVFLVHLDGIGSVLWSRQIGTSSNSRDIIKAVQQYSDGDILGTFNLDDSTAQSDPVVFKMDLNGNLKWARRFDNNGEESFTSIAFESNKVYVSGFYTSKNKAGVLSILNSADGVLLSSQHLYASEPLLQQEVANMEIRNNKISYSLWMYDDVGNVGSSKMILIQSDLSGNKSFETVTSTYTGRTPILMKRTTDDGFMFLQSGIDYSTPPTVIKLNRFNSIEWSTIHSDNPYDFKQKNRGFDITSADGGVTAGYYNNYSTGGINKMVVVKSHSGGEVGSCVMRGNTFFTDTVTLQQLPFSWSTNVALSTSLSEVVAPIISPFPITGKRVCDTVFCVDKTPLAPPCNKTSLVEYSASSPIILRDVIGMDDGGKIAVGDIANQGLITKFKRNGDIDWSKKIDEFSHNTIFLRVIKDGTGNVLAFANNYYVIDHQAYRTIKVAKLDNSGNILFTKEITRGKIVEVADVFATPDGGFLIVLNQDYGLGYTHSDVIRFDKNLAVVWKKELKHFVSTPVYRSIFCTADAVYIGHDSYDGYSQDRVGVQKLDFATGNDKWSKRFMIAGNVLRFNKIIVSNDTLFAFINSFKAIDFNHAEEHLTMMKISSSGDILNSVILNGDNLVPSNTYSYIDQASPTVTITTDNNFIFSKSVQTTSGDALNITRFDKTGNGIWSKNYPALNRHTVYNVHAQDKGVIVLGTVNRPQSLYPIFNNAFLLKTDSLGEVISNASGNCAVEARPFTTLPLTVTEIDSGIDSVIDLTYFSIDPSVLESQNTFLDATLFCNQTATCTAVNVEVKGNACLLSDTMVYYIAGSNCGAVAKWTYDTSFFKFVSISSDSLKVLPKFPGTSIIKVEIETPCSITKDSIQANVSLTAFQLNVGADTVICPGNKILLKAGSGYKKYSWNDMSTDSILWVTSPGIYYVSVTDNCGGNATDSILVKAVGNTFHITGNAIKCNYDTVVLITDTGFYNYQWSPSANLQFNKNIAIANPLQTTTYYAQAEKFPGCIVKDSFLLTVKNSPVINLGKDTMLCYNKIVKLDAPIGFVNYVWSDGTNGTSIDIYNPGVYFITATYTNNCISRDTIEIKKYPFKYPQLGADTSICSGTNFKLSPGIYASYLWNTQLNNTSSIIVADPGVYSVTVVDQYGCSAADTVSILNVYDQPKGFLKDSMQTCPGDIAYVNVLKPYAAYEWSGGSTGNSISVKQVGAYSLSVTDEHGCRGIDTINIVKKQNCPISIYFTNAFTPNNDGVNELFRPIITGRLEKYSFTIFNRFGQIIYKTNNITGGWDGKFNNQQQPAGNYVFVCVYKLGDSPEVEKKGNFILIR